MTVADKAFAVGLHEAGTSTNEIARRLHRQKGTIRTLLQKHNNTHNMNETVKRKPGTGFQNKKTTPREDRRIVREGKRDCFLSRAQIARATGVNVSRWTISRRLRAAGYHSYWAARKPYISPRNRVRRLAWANQHQNWTVRQWKKVLWSDESPFVLQYRGRKRVWRLHNERYRVRCMQATIKYDKKINVWGCFAYGGVGHLYRVKGILVKEKYLRILKLHMRPSARNLFGRRRFIFQHDNDPKHTAHIVRDHLARRTFQTMQWPAQSPDINPIENLWSELDRTLSTRKPRNEDELFHILQQGWQALSARYIHHLIRSMPRRCQAVIRSGGMPTSY